MLLSLLLLCGVLLAGLVAVAALSRRKKRTQQVPAVIGRAGAVVAALRPEGAVLVAGELWRARVRSGGCVKRGRVRVVGARGHLLEVEAET